MRSLTSLRTITAGASLALAGVLAAAPEASAAISAPGLNSPQVLDNGSTLRVPVNVTADGAADSTAAKKVADAFLGGWADGLIDYAIRNTPQATRTCLVTATVTDPNGAAGTASATVPAGASLSSLNVPNQVRGARWGSGDFDRFGVKVTCTDTYGNTSHSELTFDQNATAE